ncbi:MAG: carbohydrate kinase [Bacteroidaceae bacterium]|nr:carbohydrate kinase [Bacteroidaceae bacterium]
MKDTIVGIGEALWDCLPEGRKLGGAPANFAYHIGQFGWRSKVVSAVGNDALGDEILQVFQKVKLPYDIAKVVQPTGTVQVTLSADGIPSYEICEDVAWDNIPWTEELSALAARTKAVCFGSLAQRSPVSRQTIMRFLASMDEDTERIYDINLRQHFYSLEVIEESLRQATMLKLNDEEIVIVANLLGLNGSIEEQCRQMLHRYPRLRLVVLTCGAIGSYVFSADETSYIETPKVKVADTVGAGDSFTATFVAHILAGVSVSEAHKKAVAVSAYVCTQHGAMPKLPEDLKNIRHTSDIL